MPVNIACKPAYVCHAYGDPPDIRLDQHASVQELAADEVLIQVEYAAFNFTDYLLVQGKYQDKPALPFVPGLDAAGIVLRTGEHVQGVSAGDRVISSGVTGAWAAQLKAPAKRLVKVPAAVPLDQAIASVNSHLTAYHGLMDRAALRAGESVLILGANGAVGKACQQIAEHAGARVHTLSRSGDGFVIRSLTEASETHATQDNLKAALREALGPSGADVVVDPVGGAFTEVGVRSLGWRGRLLVIGFAAGGIPNIPTNLLLLKGASLVGVYCGGLLIRQEHEFTKQLAAMLELMAEGVLTPLEVCHCPVSAFSTIWSRYTQAASGTKVVLDMRPAQA